LNILGLVEFQKNCFCLERQNIQAKSHYSIVNEQTAFNPAVGTCPDCDEIKIRTKHLGRYAINASAPARNLQIENKLFYGVSQEIKSPIIVIHSSYTKKPASAGFNYYKKSPFPRSTLKSEHCKCKRTNKSFIKVRTLFFSFFEIEANLHNSFLVSAGIILFILGS